MKTTTNKSSSTPSVVSTSTPAVVSGFTLGLDLGDRAHHVCVLDAAGQILGATRRQPVILRHSASNGSAVLWSWKLFKIGAGRDGDPSRVLRNPFMRASGPKIKNGLTFWQFNINLSASVDLTDS
jgi:hypothetical protein